MVFVLVLTIILSAILQVFFPWWIIVAVALLAGYMSPTTAFKTFSAAFLGIAVLWLGFMLVVSLFGSTVVLPRMAELFQLPHGVLIYPISILVGALPAGLAAVTAWYFRKAIGR